jgi:PDZ domain-containing secreted protein
MRGIGSWCKKNDNIRRDHKLNQITQTWKKWDQALKGPKLKRVIKWLYILGFLIILLVMFLWSTPYIQIKPRLYTMVGEINPANAVIINSLPNSFIPFNYTTARDFEAKNLSDVLYVNLYFKHPTSNKFVKQFNSSKKEDDDKNEAMRQDMGAHILINAFQLTGKREVVTIKPTVSVIYSNYSGGKDLQVGDRILTIDGTTLFTREQWLTLLANFSFGEKHELMIDRLGMQKAIAITNQEKDNFGLLTSGFEVFDVGEISNGKKVTDYLDFSKMEGDSAGIMTTLELVQEWKGENLTKGYKIAGTGTIRTDGTIGPIGATDYKIRAAKEGKADIFFVPAYHPVNWVRWYNEKTSNEAVALNTAKKIHATFKIVPISTIQEALEYLKKQPSK